MKTIIIIIIIVSVLYCIGIGQDQPAPKAPARNRTAEDRKTLQVFWDAADSYMDIPELEPEATDLMRKVEAALKFGFNQKDMAEFRSIVKDLYKRASMIQQPD